MTEAHIKLLCILGHPIAHSLSPALHNYLIDRLNLGHSYLAFDVAPDDLSSAVAGLRVLGAAGFNVTVPHKQTVMPLLDEVSAEAQTLGAVNTVTNDGGRLVGHNTDWMGFLQPLAGVDLAEKHALILGAGGGANGVAYALIQQGIGRITIANRTLSKAQALAGQIQTRLNVSAVEGIALEGHALRSTISDAHLLVNTTPVGMWPDVANSPLPRDLLPPDLIVYDLVYNPLDTQLLKDAQRAGARTIEGLGMLIGQGVAALSLWTGATIPEVELQRVRQVLIEALTPS